MSPIIIKNRSSVDVCSVTRSGIGMVQGVVEKAGWKIGDSIQVGFIEKAKCILLGLTSGDDGFGISYANTKAKKKTGGKIYCVAFIRNYLQTLVELPKKNLLPVFLRSSDWTLALLLEPLEWCVEDFTKSGANSIPKDSIGVYGLLGKRDALLRIGEGSIKDRINTHLQDTRFSPPTVKRFRYFVLDSQDDGKILEKVLIEEYENETGVLPRFQEIRA